MLKKLKVLFLGVLLVIILSFVGIHASYQKSCLQRYAVFDVTYSVFEGCRVLIDGNLVPAKNPWVNPFE